MLFLHLSLSLIGLCGTAFGRNVSKSPHPPGLEFYNREIDLLAQLRTRLTGSPNHTEFVDYLENELKSLGLEVHSQHFEFDYNEPPETPLFFDIDGQSVPPSSYVPYSGNTGVEGVSGRLVQVENPASASILPNWTLAAESIALINISNTPLNGAVLFPVWPGSQTWGSIAGVPAINPVRGLDAAAAAGVKGVVYNWLNISSLNAFGQYAPFKLTYQGVPALFVTNQEMKQVHIQGASIGSIASTGKLTPKTKTRSIHVIFEGTELKNESVIINTHTDGNNVVEENGHIALLAKARELAASPPRRTTVLVFVTGHLHAFEFTSTGRVMERWLQGHPELWAGNTSSAARAVFGSCVEHLGAVHWREDLPNNLYYPTGSIEDELLYAATPELASLLGKTWQGAIPGLLRAVNPISSPNEQSGEGLPFLWNNIPEISLVTSPDYLLKIWPEDFDQKQLVDIAAMKRQVESFLSIWQTVDKMESTSLGSVNYTRIPEGL